MTRVRLARVVAACVFGAQLLAFPTSASADRGDVRAAHHELTRSDGQVVAETLWVLAEGAEAGDTAPLAAPLPAETTFDVPGARTSLEARRDRDGRIVALRFLVPYGAGNRLRMRTATPLDALPRDHLPIAAHHSTAVHRVSVRPPLRYQASDPARLRSRAGIRVATGIGRRTRRAADQTLDGPLSHRLLGAVYLAPTTTGVPGRIEARPPRDGLMVVTGAVFVVAAFALWVGFRRAQRAVEVEQAEAYLADQLPREEAESMGIRMSPHDTARPNAEPG